jgi:hypothetical protein
MRWLLLGTMVLLAACGGGVAGPSEQPVPPAAVIATGSSQWVNCLPVVNVCTFQAEIRNSSQGCAGNVRGTTRFENAAGVVLGSFNWNGPATVMRPNETFVYTIPNVGQGVWSVPTTFFTQPSWDNVRC